MKKYAPHKCLMCDEITTNINYCDTHLRALTKLPWRNTISRVSIISDRENGVGLRRESVNLGRG